jgi:hypothetical protein
MIMTGRKWFGALALLSTLIGCSGYASEPIVEARALGTVMMRAPSSVMINGAPALSGTTVYRGDVLKTLNASTALVRLRSGVSLALSENSEVGLEGADAAAAGTEKLNLRRGAINLRNPRAQAEWVTVPGAAVLVQGEGGFPAVCRIAAVGQSAAIINDRGHVEIRGAGGPLLLPLGQYATLEAGRPQGGSTEAGAVTAEIPKGNVQRNGQTASIPLKLNDKVYFMDLVQTESLGRVRIQLLDGSLLNVGARSQMRITRHDAQTQQTEIELTAGKLRSEVQKISKQGGSFQVKTQTAVIGVVGTHFLVAAESNRTRVWCYEGEVSVRNLNAAIVGTIVLHAGQVTSIASGLPPAAASSFSPSVMHTQISQTNAANPVGAAGGVGGMANVANAGTAGAGAASATTAGVAVSHANSAITLANETAPVLTSTNTSLGTASTGTSTALNSANSATASVGSSTGILTGLGEALVSPTYPCGCH